MRYDQHYVVDSLAAGKFSKLVAELIVDILISYITKVRWRGSGKRPRGDRVAYLKLFNEKI